FSFRRVAPEPNPKPRIIRIPPRRARGQRSAGAGCGVESLLDIWFLLRRKPEGEADDLRLVVLGLYKGDGKVDGEGCLAQEGEGEAYPGPDAGADDAELHVALHVAEVGEDHPAEHVFVDREIQLDGAVVFEVAADLVVLAARARA